MPSDRSKNEPSKTPGQTSNEWGGGQLVAKENLNFIAPGIVNSDQNDLDLAIKVSK